MSLQDAAKRSQVPCMHRDRCGDLSASDWSARILEDAQIHYTALDAWVTFQLGLKQ